MKLIIADYNIAIRCQLLHISDRRVTPVVTYLNIIFITSNHTDVQLMYDNCIFDLHLKMSTRNPLARINNASLSTIC